MPVVATDSPVWQDSPPDILKHCATEPEILYRGSVAPCFIVANEASEWTGWTLGLQSGPPAHDFRQHWTPLRGLLTPDINSVLVRVIMHERKSDFYFPDAVLKAFWVMHG